MVYLTQTVTHLSTNAAVHAVHGHESNSQPVDHESAALTTTPPIHLVHFFSYIQRSLIPLYFTAQAVNGKLSTINLEIFTFPCSSIYILNGYPQSPQYLSSHYRSTALLSPVNRQATSQNLKLVNCWQPLMKYYTYTELL